MKTCWLWVNRKGLDYASATALVVLAPNGATAGSPWWKPWDCTCNEILSPEWGDRKLKIDR